MNLWIRSQDKETLIKCEKILVEEDKDRFAIVNYIDTKNWFRLGIYKTEKRALEVLDEIQNILKPNIEYVPIVEEDVKPEYTYKHYKSVGYEVHGCKFEQFDTYVYEMPKE